MQGVERADVSRRASGGRMALGVRSSSTRAEETLAERMASTGDFGNEQGDRGALAKGFSIL